MILSPTPNWPGTMMPNHPYRESDSNTAESPFPHTNEGVRLKRKRDSHHLGKPGTVQNPKRRKNTSRACDTCKTYASPYSHLKFRRLVPYTKFGDKEESSLFWNTTMQTMPRTFNSMQIRIPSQQRATGISTSCDQLARPQVERV
jgi:hypothetical protein